MKTVWVVNTRNDFYSENSIYIYANKDEAMNFFKEIIEDKKDEREFSYEDGDTEATWEYCGYYCSICIWEEEVR